MPEQHERKQPRIEITVSDPPTDPVEREQQFKEACRTLAELIVEAIETSLVRTDGKDAHLPEFTGPDLIEASLQGRRDVKGSNPERSEAA